MAVLLGSVDVWNGLKYIKSIQILVFRSSDSEEFRNLYHIAVLVGLIILLFLLWNYDYF